MTNCFISKFSTVSDVLTVSAIERRQVVLGADENAETDLYRGIKGNFMIL